MGKLRVVKEHIMHLLAKLRRKKDISEMLAIGQIDTGIALRAMAMENSLLQSYRNLFLGIEAALFASVFALIELGMAGKVWIIGIAGLVFCAFWIVVCEAKGRDVDKWMKYLTENAREKESFSYMKVGFTLQREGGRFARRWFNIVMPVGMIVLWIWMMHSVFPVIN